MSVITKLLAVALGFRWKPSIRNDIIAVNEKPQVTVEVIDKIPVIIADT